MNGQLTAEVVARAASLAGRAPSLHNTHPWQWVFDGRVLQLHAVPERMLPVADGAGRQLLLSCGIVLHHMRSALAVLGWRTSVRRLPAPARPGHLADLEWEPTGMVTEAEYARAAAISRRYTDRLPYEAPVSWDEFVPSLRAGFAPDDAVLDIVPSKCGPALRRISGLATGLQRYDSRYHAELYWWTGHVVQAAGIPRTALVSAAEREQVAVGRHMPAGGTAVRRAETVDRARILAVSSESDRPQDVLRAGEVLSAVLLDCTAAGYATCTLTHMTEFAPSRAELRTLLGGRVLPQALIRVGTRPVGAQTPPPRPRLPRSEILEAVPSAVR
ncbi:Acg family FMN-binding oxidoreductase [Nocardia stercoris]|uniref:NAD(P)H nitroreductase n=1 Tax=Nocardia stercoris TaxID=2483361 RepID=A0A3M2KTQ7_9NOCA|nr:NAD(P)H nitroreductase [Nocardia stercoris]RMI27850.1 NAD(P)H nitroreductase [Nocardia stercoris]